MLEVLGRNPNPAHVKQLESRLLIAHAVLQADPDLFVPNWINSEPERLKLFVSPSCGVKLIRTLSELNEFAQQHSHDLEFIEGTRQPTDMAPVTLPTLRGEELQVVITPAIFVVSGIEVGLRTKTIPDHFRNMVEKGFIDPSEAYHYGLEDFNRPPTPNFSHLSELAFVGGG